MVKYSDATTEAEVGDIVKCVKDSECRPRYDLRRDCTFIVEGVNPCANGLHITVDGVNYLADRFELIKRTGAAPSPEPEQPAVNHEQSPPLVAWPDAGPLTFEKLSIKELFVTAEAPQTVRVKISDTEACVIAGGTHGIGHVFCPWDVHRIVFRVKQAVAPQFTVI